MRRILFIFTLLVFSHSSFSQFTQADTLRGSLREERTCFDVKYYHLNIDVDTLNQSILGYNEILFLTLENTERIQIDLFANMIIDSIVFRRMHLDFKREFNAVFVDFPGTILKDNVEKIKVYYHGKPIQAKKAPWDGGFVWRRDKNGKLWMGVACEGIGASLWWPNKDHLSDEPDSMRITCTVPEGLQCISNGNLEKEEGQKSVNKGQGVNNSTQTFHWKVSYPINNYNVTLNIGDYVHFQEYYVSGKDSMSCDYYVLPYNLEKAKVQFKQVKPMLKIYEDLFGRYPFWNDGYALVETPYLGMEHQGAIAYGNKYRPGYNGHVDSALASLGVNFDYIIIHESGHEYWGNSVSINDIADMWIHEGFCTYTEALYVEKMYGYDAALKYMEVMKRGIDNDKAIIGTYGVNNEGSSDMYPKGAWMLYTIRNVMNNDSLWFACLKGIQEEFKMKNVTTDEIRVYMEKVLKIRLGNFFQAYLHNSEIPLLNVIVDKGFLKNKVYFSFDPKYREFFSVAYSIDNGKIWNNVDFNVLVPMCDRGLFTKKIEWKNEITLTKKQFKNLRFNNHLFLYDVKFSKAAKK